MEENGLYYPSLINYSYEKLIKEKEAFINDMVHYI